MGNNELNFFRKEILITGGTGSLGKTLIKKLQSLPQDNRPHGIRVFSRDELKQWELKNELKKLGIDKNVSFLLGDVRDLQRLYLAFAGVDIVINCAAQKQVPSCEENPLEAVKTNVDGTANIIDAALNRNVSKVIHISTDKAVYPINLYGATKTVAEKLILSANIYHGGHFNTVFSCIRYGNVLGSRGSIIPLFQGLEKAGKPIQITDERMTRFFIKLPQVADFILSRIDEMEGGEIFVPKMKAIKISKLADIIAPDAQKEFIGIRPGEKLHECLISEEEMSRKIIDMGNYFIITQNEERDFTAVAPWTSDLAEKDSIWEKGDLLDGLFL